MKKIFAFSLLVAASALIPVRAADPPAPVYCASFTPFQFRVSAHGKSPEQRANEAMNVINTFLAGKPPVVKTKPQGKDVKIIVINKAVAVVTPADAAAEKAKSPAALAAAWSSRLRSAFKQSCAQR